MASAHDRQISADSHLDRLSVTRMGPTSDSALGDGPRRRSSSPSDGAGSPRRRGSRSDVHRRPAPSPARVATKASQRRCCIPTTSSVQCGVWRGVDRTLLCLGRRVAVPPLPATDERLLPEAPLRSQRRERRKEAASSFGPNHMIFSSYFLALVCLIT